MKTLVTGASGFLGTALCAKLEADGQDVVKLNSKNCDLTREASLLNFNDHYYDHIYHLAAWTQAGDFAVYHPGEQWIINQQINTNILAWWHKYQPQAKMICMGTSCAYAPELELKEENYLIGTPIDSLYTYAMTKRMLYVGLLSLSKQFGLKYLCLVPSTLFGPGYHTDDRQMHFIFDLMRKIIRGKVLNEPVILWGDGNQKRELVYIDDFVNIMLELSSRIENSIVNIGAGKEFSIKQFANIICAELGYDFNKIIYDTDRYVGAKSKVLDVSKLMHLFPDLKMKNPHEGIHNTIEWMWERREIYLK